jgi:hypothetical protein
MEHILAADGESLAAAVVFVTKPSWSRIKRILVAA